MAWEDELFTAATWAALLVAGWWIMGAVLWAIASETQDGRISRTLGQLTLPGSRRLASAAVAVGVMTSAGCSGGDDEPPAMVWIDDDTDDVDAPTTRTPDASPTTVTTRSILTTEATTADPPAAPDEDDLDTEAESPAETREHVVVPGDNLWTIAEADLLRSEPDADQFAVATHWRRIIDLNRTTLRSGDPDLILPGERVQIPATPIDS